MSLSTGLITLVTIIMLGTLLFLAGWNLGVVAMAAACGAHVGTIGYFNAFGGLMAVSFVARMLHGRNAPLKIKPKT